MKREKQIERIPLARKRSGIAYSALRMGLQFARAGRSRFVAVVRYLGGKQYDKGIKQIDWRSRATQLGAYSVIDTRHAPEEYDLVTRRQKEILIPVLAECIGGLREGDALDYGCGVGRFTSELLQFVDGVVYGFDPTAELIVLAPTGHPRMQFTTVETNVLSHEVNHRYALIWVCLVLGGLSDDAIREVVPRLNDTLKDDGLIFIVEATGDTESGSHWRIRTIDQLKRLFEGFDLSVVSHYFDVDQKNSVLIGRKCAAN